MNNKGRTIDPDYGKIPPQALEIEEAILGAILLESTAYLKVSHYFNKYIFYKDCNQKIMDAIQILYEKGGSIDILTVTDQLKITNLLDDIGGATYLISLTAKVANANHLEFHCRVITDKYLLRELIRIGHEMAKKAYNEEDPSEVAEWAENEILDNFDIEGNEKASFKDALRTTLIDISNKAKGIISSFIVTGDPEIDSKISLRERQILLIAGAEGHGKTKYVTYIIRKIINQDKDIRVLWFSMEDTKEQIIRSFISMEIKLTTKQLQSINYTLSQEQLDKISYIIDNFDEYNIQFVDHVSSMRTITRKTRLLREKYKTSKLILIVDNLGLITTDSFLKGIDKDDYVAGKLKEISDIYNISVILLHHITKESAKKFNLEEGYRPRKEYIKGSTRILDYVQQAIMINLPRRYKDLISEERNKAKVFSFKIKEGKFNISRFEKEFWPINPEGDKNTKDIPDLLKATWDALKYAVTIDKLSDGSDIRAGYILNKYNQYFIHMEEKNRGRLSQYKSEKMCIYSFIVNKKWTEDYSPKQNSRSYYLYGNNLNLMSHINELFIVESAKNRDGDDADDNNIIRYKANLGYNTFEPIIEIDDKPII